MASLAEDLITEMKEEKELYDKLYELSSKKRETIIHQQLEEMESLVNQEQDVASELKNLENKRVRTLKDMSSVLGQDRVTLTVSQIIKLLNKHPEERSAIKQAKDELVRSAEKMQLMNQQNQILLQQAIEMTNFDMQLIKSMKGAPETANYNKDAYNTGDILPSSGFDTKQ